jgi:endonuclease-3
MKETLKKVAGRTSISPTNPARIAAILDGLEKAYPNAVCALHHKSAWQLLVATILSAQCTDVRVNQVTPALFRAFPTPKAMAAASLPELEELIRTTGFFRNKAKSLQGAGRVISEEFHGKVPQTMPELLRIPGVARKTANVVLGSWFKIADGIVVDTHVLRIARRLQLTKETTPEKVERDLMRLIPQAQWIDFTHRIISHGRAICIARKPRCADCPLEPLCNAPDKTFSSH